MAAVNVTITGVLIDLYGRTISGPLKLVGEAVYSDLGVGGGPIIPPSGGGNGKPPGTWGGAGEPFPTPPIHIPPGKPEVPPPSIWPPGPGIDFPSHPIVIPPEWIDKPIPPGTMIKWEADWSVEHGWAVVGYPQFTHPAPS